MRVRHRADPHRIVPNHGPPTHLYEPEDQLHAPFLLVVPRGLSPLQRLAARLIAAPAVTTEGGRCCLVDGVTPHEHADELGERQAVRLVI